MRLHSGLPARLSCLVLVSCGGETRFQQYALVGGTWPGIRSLASRKRFASSSLSRSTLAEESRCPIECHLRVGGQCTDPADHRFSAQASGQRLELNTSQVASRPLRSSRATSSSCGYWNLIRCPTADPRRRTTPPRCSWRGGLSGIETRPSPEPSILPCCPKTATMCAFHPRGSQGKQRGNFHWYVSGTNAGSTFQAGNSITRRRKAGKCVVWTQTVACSAARAVGFALPAGRPRCEPARKRYSNCSTRTPTKARRGYKRGAEYDPAALADPEEAAARSSQR